MKDKRIGVEEVFERFGLRPDQMVEMMGLAGDAIDNIPGVPGIGEKTATELIKTFGSIENLLSHLDQVHQKKLKEKLETYGEQARLSRHLATIRTDIPISIELKDYRLPSPDRKALREIFKELEFNKLLRDLPEESRSGEKDYRLVTDWDVFQVLLKDLGEASCFSIDLETTSPLPGVGSVGGNKPVLHPSSGFLYSPWPPEPRSDPTTSSRPGSRRVESDSGRSWG